MWVVTTTGVCASVFPGPFIHAPKAAGWRAGSGSSMSTTLTSSSPFANGDVAARIVESYRVSHGLDSPIYTNATQSLFFSTKNACRIRTLFRAVAIGNHLEPADEDGCLGSQPASARPRCDEPACPVQGRRPAGSIPGTRRRAIRAGRRTPGRAVVPVARAALDAKAHLFLILRQLSAKLVEGRRPRAA